MKIRFPFRIFLLFFYLLTFASASAAQEKPRALKFDEFDDVGENSFYAESDKLTFSERIERFAKRLEKERGVWAYVIYYQARIAYEDVQREFINQVEGIESRLEYDDRIKIKDALITNGGYRENNSVEFWVVPENANLPAPTPIFNRAENFVCPRISFYDDTPAGNTETINFRIPEYILKEIKNYTLTWRVSVGEIVEGQGLNYIKVKLNDSAVKRVTAYLEVGGLPFPCPKVFSRTAEVYEKLFMLDSFGMITNGDTRSRLDNFLVNLMNNPAAKGYIIVYGNRTDKFNRDAERIITLINNHFRFRNFDVSRIIIVRGGFREEISSELWLSFDDAEKPIPTPTVDEKFVVVPKSITKPRPRKK